MIFARVTAPLPAFTFNGWAQGPGKLAVRRLASLKRFAFILTIVDVEVIYLELNVAEQGDAGFHDATHCRWQALPAIYLLAAAFDPAESWPQRLTRGGLRLIWKPPTPVSGAEPWAAAWFREVFRPYFARRRRSCLLADCHAVGLASDWLASSAAAAAEDKVMRNGSERFIAVQVR